MYELIMRAVLGAPWAIMPEKLAAIEGVLRIRAAGGRVSAEEIVRVTGGRRVGEGTQIYLPATKVAATDTKPASAGYWATARVAHTPRGGQADEVVMAAGGGEAGRGGTAVAVLPIYGSIHQHADMLLESSGGTSTDAIGRAVRSALNDPQVGALVLDVDSPGGSVFGVDELSELIFSLRGSKPVVAVADSLMASAAYWIGTAADEVLVTPGGLVGSIGVYQAHVDRSGAYEKDGERVSFVSAGKYKIEGNDAEPLGDEARAAMQGMVDEYYGMFVKAVARNRGVSVGAVRNGFGEGRVVMAPAAKAAGMVDRVGTLEDAIRRAGQLSRSRGQAKARADADRVRLGVL